MSNLKNKSLEEIIKHLNYSKLGYNYYNIRVTNADVAKSIENGINGDMKKSVYDTNDDGKVDNAEHADNADHANNADYANTASNLSDGVIDGGQSDTF